MTLYVNGTVYVTAAEVEADRLLGDDVKAETVRQWGTRRMANRYRVGAVTYYSLDELTEVEHATRTSVGGRPRAAP